MRLLYSDWLKRTPVVVLAVERLSDGGLFAFLRKVYRFQDEALNIGNDHLSWYLFEEIGWPEGRIYVIGAMDRGHHNWVTETLTKHTIADRQINARLESRRLVWRKPGKRMFMAAHKALLELLAETAKQHPKPPQPRDIFLQP